MELIIILTVIIFLIGTVSIALPSKSTREISNLRLEASKLGFKIISSKLSTQSFKNKDLGQDKRTIFQLRKELQEKELENKILKELLKKTTQTLIKD